MDIQLRHQPSFSVARFSLAASEAVRAEAGAMLAMAPDIQLEAKAEGGMLKSLKRAALGACIVFLRLNGIEPKADGPEWEELTLSAAASTIDRDETTTRLRTLLAKKDRAE